MPTIYAYDTAYTSEKNTPGKLRQPKRLAWLRVLLYPLQKRFIDTFNYYRLGQTAPTWNKIPTYTVGYRVRFGISIWEAIEVNTFKPPPEWPEYWILVQPDWIGCEERIKYNSQIMVYEYLMNKRFPNTYNTNRIWISTNTTDSSAFWVGSLGGEKTTSYAATKVNQNNFIGLLSSGYTVGYYNFTINVPLALFNSLGANDTIRENVIRSVADKYKLAGMFYNVVTFVPTS